jgi:hypothetical protein
VGVQVLRGLHPCGERLVVERLVHARAEEADERARLRHRDVSERAPRRHDATGRGVAEVHEIGEARGLVRRDGGGDLHHLHEGDRALLHPGATGHGCGEQREALGGGALDRGDEALRGRDADRPGEEAELAGHHDDAPAPHEALAGDHGLVEAGLLLGRAELGGVLLGDRAADGRGVPGRPGPLVEDEVDQLGGGEALAHSAHSAGARMELDRRWARSGHRRSRLGGTVLFPTNEVGITQVT